MKHLVVQDVQLEIHNLSYFHFLTGIFSLKPGLVTYFYIEYFHCLLLIQVEQFSVTDVNMITLS